MGNWQSKVENVVTNSIARVRPEFWRNRRVFITGHTGFKGGWLCTWLVAMGAKITGFALKPNTEPCLFDALGIDAKIERSVFGDIRDDIALNTAMTEANPEIVIHMAAQPLVRRSYTHPVETYSTNVMGTVNVLEAVRKLDSVRAVVVVSTDKCYENEERGAGYRETEPMGGFDPYSSSKGCAELVVAAYRRSFFFPKSFPNESTSIASVRAGNVIGGGDWSVDRLVPDAIRAFESNRALVIRNPDAIRPWQHVLEPLTGYLVLAQNLVEVGTPYAEAWNFGPDDADTQPVKSVIDMLVAAWGGAANWVQTEASGPHEAHVLRLDCTKARQRLGWYPVWNLECAVGKTVAWYRQLAKGGDMFAFTLSQINDHQNNSFSK